MITSLFSKSKPINFIVVFFITLIAFFLARFSDNDSTVYSPFFWKQLFLFFTCFGTILLLNFIVTKNSLSKDINFEILLFSLFLLAFFKATQDINILASNFFVLLALRRILSIRSQLNLIKKFFDAAFWIAIASLFYFWSILFFILIIVSLIVYADKKLTHWLIPFIGVFTVAAISVSISILLYNSYFGMFNGFFEISFDYTPYNSISYLIAITTMFSFGIWSAYFYLNSIKQKKKNFRASFGIIFFAALFSFFIILLAPKKDGSEFLFMFAPLSIIIANYIEIIDEKWFKELFLSVLIIVPFIVLALQLIV